MIRNPKAIQDLRRRHRRREKTASIPEAGIDAFKQLKDHFEEIVDSISINTIIETVRRLSPSTYMKYFKGYRPQSLGRSRVTQALKKEIFENENAAVADLVNLLWNQSNRNIYKAMHDHVRKINENVEEIERIEDDTANEIIDDLLTKFSRKEILFCVRLNEVKFSEEVIQKRLVRGEDDWERTSEKTEETKEEEKQNTAEDSDNQTTDDGKQDDVKAKESEEAAAEVTEDTERQEYKEEKQQTEEAPEDSE